MKRREFLRTGLALGTATIATETTNTKAESEEQMRGLDPDEIGTPLPEKSETLTLKCWMRLDMPEDVLTQEQVEMLLSMTGRSKQSDFAYRLGCLGGRMRSEMGLDLSFWGGRLGLIRHRVRSPL